MSTTQQADIIKHQPASEDELFMRAQFYAHSLNGMCKRQIDMILNRCDAGEFGPEAQETVSTGISDQAFNAAVKVINCMSIHMLGLDCCGEGGPVWLIQFMFETIKESEEQSSEPPAARIIEQHGSWKRERMCHDVAQHACEILGLPVTNRKLVELLYNFLLNSGALRNEMLLFALSQPPDALRHHLQVFS